MDSEAEIVVLCSIGDYVAFGDSVAELRTDRGQDVSSLESVVRKAVILEEQRDLDIDPGFGIEQLATIGWTSISTAKSNPDPGLQVIWNLRDLLARWLETDEAFGAGDITPEPAPPVVYFDNIPERLMMALESLVVVASESMQHQSAAELYRTFAGLFHRLPPPLQGRAEDLVLRSLSGLGDHVLTADLEASLSAVADAMARAGRFRSSDAIRVAQEQLGSSIGRLNSRSTRTEAIGERILPNG